MDTLSNDPRTKQQIRDFLIDFLYAPPKDKLQKRLQQLIDKNCQLIGCTHKHFVYKGVVYTSDIYPVPHQRTRLHPALKPLMDEYLGDIKKIYDEEMPYVLGFITQVLNASNSIYDYLRLLPESVHSPLETFISTCVCQTKNLTDEQVKAIIEKNAAYILLLKSRMVKNLID